MGNSSVNRSVGDVVEKIVDESAEKPVGIKSIDPVENRAKKKYSFFSLAPVGYEEEQKQEDNEAYFSALDYALKQSSIKNIAISGNYGSGKTSVINKYLEHLKKNTPSVSCFKKLINWIKKYFRHQKKDTQNLYTVLRVSLATFTQENNGAHEEKLRQHLLEASLLQQILYSVKSNELPESQFDRIEKVNKRDQVSYYLTPLLFVFGLYGLFTRKTESILDFQFLSLLSISRSNIVLVSLLCALPLLTLLLHLAHKNIRLKKLSLLKGEFDLEDQKKTLFNQQIDEILYFFEVTEFNVVCFEDIDRFGSRELFTKLRELNFLINSAKQVDKRVVFIYAIKDELFSDPYERTKFFDFIIPIIPFIDSSNSAERLISKLEKIGRFKNEEQHDGKHHTISSQFIRHISLYINDMRLLKNIINEYTIYSSKIFQDLKQENLLALVIYKNLHPEEFALIHSRKGLLVDLVNSYIDKRHQLAKSQEFDSNIIETKAELKSLREETNNSIEKLRSEYVSHLIGQAVLDEDRDLIIYPPLPHNISSPNINAGKNYKELLSDEALFKKFIQQKIFFLTQQSDSQITLNVSLEGRIDSSRTYDQRRELVNKKITGDVTTLEQELQKLKEEKEKINSLNLKDFLPSLYKQLNIMTDDPFEDIPDVNKEEVAKTTNRKIPAILHYFLLNGYINESYYNYISLFHSVSITLSDKHYVHEVLEGREYTEELFNQRISNPRLIFENYLSHDNYLCRTTILNRDIICFLLENRREYDTKTSYIFKHSVLPNLKRDGVLFLELFLQEKRYEYLYSFIEIISKNHGFWSLIANHYLDNESIEDLEKVIKLIVFNVEDKDILSFTDIQLLKDQCNRPDFLTWFSEEALLEAKKFLPHMNYGSAQKVLDKVCTFLKLIDVTFDELALPTDENEKTLFRYTYENNLYSINTNMIKVIAEQYCANYESFAGSLASANLSTIMAHKDDLPELITYINEKLEQYIENVLLLDSNKYESEDILYLLLNNEEINFSTRKKIVIHQETKLSDLNRVEIENKREYIDILNNVLAHNKVVISWGNVLVYFKSCDNKIDKILHNYLSHEDVHGYLSKILTEGIENEEDRNLLSNEILQHFSFENTVYRALTKSLHDWWIDLPNKDIEPEKLDILIDNERIGATPQIIQLIYEIYELDIALLKIRQLVEQEYDYRFKKYSLESLIAGQINHGDELVFALLASDKLLSENKFDITDNLFLSYGEGIEADKKREEQLISWINDQEYGVSVEFKLELISHHSVIITDISKIKLAKKQDHKKILDLLFQEFKILTNWENILIYFRYFRNKINGVLHQFLSTEKTYQILTTQSFSHFEEADKLKLFVAIINQLKFTNAVYQHLTSNLPYIYGQVLPQISKTKLGYLLKNNILMATASNIRLMRKTLDAYKSINTSIALMKKRERDDLPTDEKILSYVKDGSTVDFELAKAIINSTILLNIRQALLVSIFSMQEVINHIAFNRVAVIFIIENKLNIDLSAPQFIKLIESAKDDEARVSLMSLNQELISNLDILSSFQDEQIRKIGQDQQRAPSLATTSTNQELLAILQDLKLIENYQLI